MLGKLLLAVGPDRIVWGTDSIWYGSPQALIDAFRAFEIPERMQEEFGYPPLTVETKAKILGVNARAVYGITDDEVAARAVRTSNGRGSTPRSRPSIAGRGHTRGSPTSTRSVKRYSQPQRLRQVDVHHVVGDARRRTRACAAGGTRRSRRRRAP